MRPRMGAAASAPLIAGSHCCLAASTLALSIPSRAPEPFQPGRRALVAHGGRAEHWPTGGRELAADAAVMGVDGGPGHAVQGTVELPPFPGGDQGTRGQIEGPEQHAEPHRIRREHLADQGHRGPLGPSAPGRLHWTLLRLQTGPAQHGRGQHILGLRMGGHPESRHVDPDHPYPVDRLRQEPQGHPGGRWDAQVDDHQGVVALRVGELVDRIAHVLEQLAGHQGLGVEGHIADAAP